MTQEFKTARDFIKEIQIFPSNLEYILQTGVINGSLLVSIQTAINAHSQQYIDANKELVEMLERAKWEFEQFKDAFGQGSLLINEIGQLILKHDKL